MVKPTKVEMALIGFVIKYRDIELLLSLTDNLFSSEACINLLNKYRTHMLPLNIFAEKLTIEEKSFLKECVDITKEYKKQDIPKLIEILEDAYMKRKLYQLSTDIYKDIENNESSYNIIRKIDKLSSTLYSGIPYNNTTETYEKAIFAMTSNSVLGYATGYKDFDELTGGIVPGNIVSVGGVSANLKSTSTLAFILNLLRVNPELKCAFFEIEMSMKDISIMLLGQLGVNRTDIIRGTRSMAEYSEMLKKEPVLERIKFYTVDMDNINGFSDIQKIILQTKPDIWVIDYMGQLAITERNVTNRSSGDHNMIFAETMLSAKLLAQRTNTIGFIIHQADSKINRTRKDVRPRMEDIEWSQDIFRVSGYVYMCFYPIKYFYIDDPIYQRLFFQIWTKARYANSTYHILEYDPPTGRFMNPSDEVLKAGWRLWDKLNNLAGINNGIRLR